MRVKVPRTGKTMALAAPQFFFAQDRSLAEEAYAGDVVGIPNRGTLRIGDAITEGEDITFLGIPSFAPEIMRRIRLEDAIRAKKLREALREMAEEGVVQVFSPLDGTPPIVGVIGALQLDVLADRLLNEYGLQTGFDPAPCDTVRWIKADDSGRAGALRRAEPLLRRRRPRRAPRCTSPPPPSTCNGPPSATPRSSSSTSRRRRCEIVALLKEDCGPTRRARSGFRLQARRGVAARAPEAPGIWSRTADGPHR